MGIVISLMTFTSITDKITGFSSVYRMNKCIECIDENAVLLTTGQHMYKISQICYYASEEDYLISNFGTKKINILNKIYPDPYPELCVMINKIYNDCG